jgi:hypothetical protein
MPNDSIEDIFVFILETHACRAEAALWRRLALWAAIFT